jgi:hypothetical protein
MPPSACQPWPPDQSGPAGHRGDQRQLHPAGRDPCPHGIRTETVSSAFRGAARWPPVRLARSGAHVLLLARVEPLRVFAVANADLRYEHAKKRGPLTALLSAYNLFGGSFFAARCRLGGKTPGRCL